MIAAKDKLLFSQMEHRKECAILDITAEVLILGSKYG